MLDYSKGRDDVFCIFAQSLLVFAFASEKGGIRRNLAPVFWLLKHQQGSARWTCVFSLYCAWEDLCALKEGFKSKNHCLS